MPGKKKAPPVVRRPMLQVVAALCGLAVTTAAIGIVLWEALQPSVPTALTAHIVSVAQTPAGHVALIRVRNAGSETAAAVQVQGVLGRETAQATIDYVPGHGEADAHLRFDADPRAARIVVQGWSAP